ncbi:outer membrane beta-barrel protein [Williamwhitmania taraxaci]|uniref:Outer membrane protein beta-barrel domain-containing protein n=1 Tax=Williamwhitmania taraxaci TaxID=1640674 RepID=A0A1G6GZN8_9BACT|nr:outer membrane beta-barrel protein [Williamwhitmania taraxaci]SDB87374.1 Outer membrane protein beta-barrel domain-containing protein [Williamwhitmania taraxaci]
MKRKLVFGIALLSSMALYTSAQDSPASVLSKLEEGDSTEILSTVSSSEVDSIIKSSKVSKSDTTRIKFGKRAIIIVENGDDTNVEFKDYDWKKGSGDFDEPFSKHKKKTGFDPHWAGVEIGINGLMNSDHSTTLKGDAAFLDLNMGKSINFNINFLEYGIPLTKKSVGLVTGMGIEFNNFRFSNDITLNEVNGVIGADSSYINGGISLSKTKLATTYLNIPLLMEFQVPAGSHKIFISGGIVGGLKLGSHTKVVYDKGGDKQKDKNRSDFNLATLRYGFHARVGYRFLKLYATYYPVALFEKDKGPEVYPFNVGIVLLDF